MKNNNYTPCHYLKFVRDRYLQKIKSCKKSIKFKKFKNLTEFSNSIPVLKCKRCDILGSWKLQLQMLKFQHKLYQNSKKEDKRAKFVIQVP